MHIHTHSQDQSVPWQRLDSCPCVRSAGPGAWPACPRGAPAGNTGPGWEPRLQQTEPGRAPRVGTRGWQGLSSVAACPHLPAGGQIPPWWCFSTVRELPLGRRPPAFSATGTVSWKTASPGTVGDSSGRNRAWGAVDEASLARPPLGSLVANGPWPRGGGLLETHGATTFPPQRPVWSCAPGVILETEVSVGHHAPLPACPTLPPDRRGPCDPLRVGPVAETHSGQAEPERGLL